MESKEKIEKLMDAVVLANLDGCELFAQVPFETVRAAYNGIGPEYLPEAVRDKVTELLALFEPAALIHDIRYTLSDGYRFGWKYANTEFRDNCLRLANAKYPWWNWRRYRARQIAHILYKCVSSEAGLKAWQDAADKNKKGK